ncbi:hypothetical protein CLV40_111162 [Actinokineospora auranticolor]|uniref:Uncharacterized protein n=1 Tax=Actinokineospora auranticolor TaxID=155976 RepID=A0A2S6GLU1_9PSEU|nr:hypothetical protein CLV40_111162 [Actinokineospora auranticolor]
MTSPTPVAGLDGTYRHSCLLCRTGTDTGLGFLHDAPEWAVAGLTLLGLPPEEAETLVLELARDDGPATVVRVRVCEDCFTGTDLRTTAMTLGVAPDIPLYSPRV